MEKNRRQEGVRGWRASGASSWRQRELLTFLWGHSDRLAVAEGPPTSARRVHFVLHAAINDPKLYLRRGRWAHSQQLRRMLNHRNVTQPTSFFTVKPTETDTKGNLHRGGCYITFTKVPAGSDSEDSNSITRLISPNFPDREDKYRQKLIKR